MADILLTLAEKSGVGVLSLSRFVTRILFVRSESSEEIATVEQLSASAKHEFVQCKRRGRFSLRPT